MIESSWEKSVSKLFGSEVGFKHSHGKVQISLRCGTCPEFYSIEFSKHFPPEVIKQKLSQKGWDTRCGKVRCPTCVSSNRKDFHHQEVKQDNSLIMRLGLTAQCMTLLVPPKNDYYGRFADENNKGVAKWSMEVVEKSSGELILVLNREPNTEGKKPGVARGSYIATGKHFSITIRNSVIAGKIDSLEPFSLCKTEVLKETSHLIILSLPQSSKKKVQQEESKPVLKLGTETRVVEMQPVEEHPPIKIEPAEPIPGLREALGVSDEPMTQPSRVSLREAIDIINSHKREMGDKLGLSVSPSGYLAVLVQYGIEE